MTGFDALIAAAGLLAGALASIVGFGIGSLLTPVFALDAGTRAAVAIVSIPHLIGTALRFVMMRGHLDRRVFVSFGLTSAAGGLTGALSGFLGGLVGNQGGIRSAALFGFPLQREAFVATATATGLVVDAARMPVYFVSERDAIFAAWPKIAIASAAVVVGTLVGRRVLTRIPEARFHRIVAVVLAVLGAAMIVSGLRGR